MHVLYLPGILRLQAPSIPEMLDGRLTLTRLDSFSHALASLVDSTIVRSHAALIAEDGQGSWLDIAGLRQCNETIPIIVVTHQRPIADARTVYLNAGATQCLPAYGGTSAELCASVSAACRPSGLKLPSRLYTFGDLAIDTVCHAVFCDGVDLELTETEFLLVNALALATGKPVTYEQLGLAASISMEQCTDHTTFAAHMKRTRSKLRMADSRVRICSRYGIGYELLEE